MSTEASKNPAWFTKAIETKYTDQNVDVDGVNIHYLLWGKEGDSEKNEKPGLIFVHGNGAHAHWWAFIAPFFINEYQVAAIDLAGAGDSDYCETYTVDIFAKQIASVVEWSGETVFEKTKGLRILWIEDSPPFTHMGAGFPRTLEMLSALLELGHCVTLLPTYFTESDFEDVYRETPREVEVALGVGVDGFESFWSIRKNVYDVAIMSRPNNLKRFCNYMEDTKLYRPSFRIIYDAEAVFANREISERRYGSNPFSESEERALLESELSPAKNADVVFAISETERVQFESLGFSNIQMLRHHSKIVPTPKIFSERRDILFVGAVHSDEAPNALGLIWFIENVLPIIRDRIGQDVKLYFAGKNHSKALEAYATDSEEFLGFVEDLDEWYDRCRVFIAPARYAAGIPLKVIEASSRGIPVVATDLAREQLGWVMGEMLSGESAEAIAEACIRVYTDEDLWECLREGALNRVRRDYSRQSIIDALEAALD